MRSARIDGLRMIQALEDVDRVQDVCSNHRSCITFVLAAAWRASVSILAQAARPCASAMAASAAATQARSSLRAVSRLICSAASSAWHVLRTANLSLIRGGANTYVLLNEALILGRRGACT